MPQKSARTATSPALTIEQFCNYIAPGVWNDAALLTWPPDTFGVAAALLLKSGGYCHAVSRWRRRRRLALWVDHIQDVGKTWRKHVNKPPSEVREWHRTLISNRDTQLHELGDRKKAERTHRKICDALLHLSAAADEACRGVGFAMLSDTEDRFLNSASLQLALSGYQHDVSTLCKAIPHSALRVLPKLHTPQSGITIRSLSHHLALCPAGDVRAKWTERIRPKGEKRSSLNLLLAPWPDLTTPSQFQSVDPERAELPHMAAKNGFFEYHPLTDDRRRGLSPEFDVYRRLSRLLKNAEKVVSRIDGVVFPELALTARESELIGSSLTKKGKFLICGVREMPKRGSRRAGRNYVRFDIPFLPGRPMSFSQDKHHRWRLDKRQIVQYGLGSCLDIDWSWWEHITIEERKLYFVALEEWLTVSALICEDLARQDPVSEIMRSVGPNLVIALLMDGPQLRERWPARYATVLADDPGSSVLTLTNIGMSELSRPPSIQTSSRAIALWKDAKSADTISINLPKDFDGVVLSLSREFQTELSADGRSDDSTTACYPTLSGIHYVSSKTK